jgi:hypothetical protein
MPEPGFARWLSEELLVSGGLTGGMGEVLMRLILGLLVCKTIL